MTVESVKNVIESFKTGKLRRYYLSEEIPEHNDAPLMTVVGKTYKEFVDDASKDIFLYFWLPDCYRCQMLAPIWD